MSSRRRRQGELASAAEYAAASGLHPRTVRRMIEREELRGMVGKPYSNDDERRRHFVHRSEIRRLNGSR